ncbi:unnamed protein product [Penicillium discolor]
MHGEMLRPTGAGVGRIDRFSDAEDRYVVHLLASLPHRLEGIHVVLDCAHGAASGVSPETFRDAGAEVTVIGADPDGWNINDGVGSTHLDNLAEAVVRLGADVGIAHDGDADRCLATAVGDRYVLEDMNAGGYALGGEQSGHVIMSEYATTGDGLLTGLHLVAEMARQGKSLAELASVMTVYPQLLINVRDVDKDRVADDEVVQQAVRDVEAELGDTGRARVHERLRGAECGGEAGGVGHRRRVVKTEMRAGEDDGRDGDAPRFRRDPGDVVLPHPVRERCDGLSLLLQAADHAGRGEAERDGGADERDPRGKRPGVGQRGQLLDEGRPRVSLSSAADEPDELADVLDEGRGAEREQRRELEERRRQGDQSQREPGAAQRPPDPRPARSLGQHPQGDGEGGQRQQGDELGLHSETDQKTGEPGPALQDHQRPDEQSGGGDLAQEVGRTLDRRHSGIRRERERDGRREQAR